MPVMPPGFMTGVYYIPVANLPWNTSWKRLKDHARNRLPDGSGLATLHATVYPGPTSTSGWVSVQGLADFRAAVKHMTHSPMEDPPRAPRTLLVDGRNETQPIMLGESSPVNSSPSPPYAQQQSTWQPVPQNTNTAPSQDNYPSWPYQNAPAAVPTPVPPSLSGNSYYQPPSPHCNHTQPFNGYAPKNEYLPSVRPGIVLIPMPPMQRPLYVVPVEQQRQMTPQAPAPHPTQMFALPQTPCPTPVSEHHPSPRVIETGPRKIIITGLPLSCSENDLQELINSVTSKPSRSPHSRHRNSPEGTTRDFLQHVQIAKHSNGSPQGHAFAVLKSHPAAKCTIEALNGLICQGRTLHARFAKEGVVESSHRDTRRHFQSSSEAGTTSWCRNISHHATKDRARGTGTRVPRLIAPKPHQYRYTGGENNAMEVDEQQPSSSAQFSNIQIGYHGDDGSSSSPPHLITSSGEESIAGVSNPRKEVKKERCRGVLSGDARSYTPVVVDGSSCGKEHR
ncbi:hypothetical protein BKA61DRAFT_656083 [Leptodontidium sp. MPI-SDFR-AT-0119]|nr:hypothetical protein BKA61DRAFT_656083 [Leptodontidium sp. MPI-SDFR-AT-0119]